MTLLRTLAMSALAIVMIVTVPQDAEAQLPCGIWCASCGFMRGTGVEDDDDHGLYEIHCQMFASCEELDCGELVTASHPSSQSLLRSLDTANEPEVSRLVSLHGERLLLDPDRNMIAILHRTQCAPEEIAENIQAVAFLSPERAELLGRLGVVHLDDFASHAGAAAGAPQE